MNTVTLSFRIEINATSQVIFEYVSDWERQSEWILFTTVKLVSRTPDHQNSTILAVTKLGPLKVADEMTVTEWQPYERIVVEHTGQVVKGKGVFTVSSASKDTCIFTWQEVVPVPFGFIGQIGLVFAKPLMHAVFGKSLAKLKDNIEARA